MEKSLTDIKRTISTAETWLKKGNREWAYYKNGSPYPDGAVKNDNPHNHYLKSQSSYSNALKFALQALEMLKTTYEVSLANKAQSIIDKCKHNKE